MPTQRGVDPKAPERVAYERAETVVADLGDHGRARSEARRLHRDVGGGAAQVLGERVDLGQRDADLLGVEIDPDAPGRDHVVG